MSWRLNLQDASFRGVPFKVSSSDTGIGRRNVVHQFPQRDTPFVEDLGRDTDEFTITGYVIQTIDNGHNYFDDRDELIDALRTEGVGTLVHPFLGEQKVALVEKARIQENFDRGGMATFTMSFVRGETDGTGFLTSIDYIGTVDASVDQSINMSGDNFTDNFVIPSQGYSRDNIIADATEFISMNKKAILSAKGVVSSTVSSALGILSTNVVNINDILASPNATATMMDTSIKAFLNIIGEAGSPVTSGIVGGWSGEYRGDVLSFPTDSLTPILGKSAVSGLVEMNRFGESAETSSPSTYGGSLEPITISTVNSARMALNRLYMINLARNFALIMACGIAIRIDYDSYDESVETMNIIVEAMDGHLIKLGDEAATDTYRDYNLLDDNNDMYSAMEQLRADFIKSMKEVGTSLAVIVEYKCPPDGITSLEIAYDRYMDLDRAEDIFQRNKTMVQHPGFLPGGQIIEILSE